MKKEDVKIGMKVRHKSYPKKELVVKEKSSYFVDQWVLAEPITSIEFLLSSPLDFDPVEEEIKKYDFSGMFDGIDTTSDYWKMKWNPMFDIPKESKEDKEQPNDQINPDHYLINGKEVLDLAEFTYGPDKVAGFLLISALKYRLRAGKKKGNSADQDIEKALNCEKLAEEYKRKIKDND